MVLGLFLAYGPALSSPFQFDDYGAIRDTTIRQLWPPSIALHPAPQRPLSGRPVVNYTLALNYALNRALGVSQRLDANDPHETVSYHLVNLLLHLACAALLFGVLRRTVRSQRFDAHWAAIADPVSLLITGVWMLHPIQSEAILYVVQRTEIIVSACYVGTLYASIRAWDAGSSRTRLGWYGVATLVCLLGMGSKEVMISAPLAVVLYDRAFRWMSWKQVLVGGRAWFYLALCATSAWLIALIASGPRNATVGLHLGMAWYTYMYSQAWAILHYVQLFFWPTGLSLDYGRAPVTGLRGVPGVVLLGLFGIATVWAWIRVRRWGWLAFAGAWFFMLLAPSSSIVPIITEIAAERRIYLALAAIIVLTVVAVDAVWRRVALRRGSAPSWSPAWKAAGASILGLCLVAATYARGQTYHDQASIWRDVVAKQPHDARAYENLAVQLLDQHPPREEEAAALLRQSIAVDSTYPNTWDRLAAIDVHQGRLAEAKALLDHALTLDQKYPRTLQGMGSLLMKAGDAAGAIPFYQRAIGQGESADDQYFVDLATAYMTIEQVDSAMANFRRALRLNPNRVDVMDYLGALLTEYGRPAEAIPYLEDAARQEPDSGLGFALLSLADAASGRVEPAVDAAREATAHAGGDVRVYLFSGRAMLQAHQAVEAEQYLGRGMSMDTSDAEVMTELGEAKAALGKRDEAIQLLRRALVLAPSDAPARQALDRLGAGQ
jgi:protein O-mannosyl-transferase